MNHRNVIGGLLLSLAIYAWAESDRALACLERAWRRVRR